MYGTGRNRPCPCGSGKKYKKCCLKKQRDAAFKATRGEGSYKQELAARGRVQETGSPPGNLQRLIQKGYDLNKKGDFKDAEAIWSQALQESEDDITRNNLAVALFFQGEYGKCWEVLKPMVVSSSRGHEWRGNPFTWSLASRVNAFLGHTAEAKRYLETAVRLFEEGLPLREKTSLQDATAWKEYTVAIMRAAADLKDHTRVWDYYLRWKNLHVSWENLHMAAVAGFNLGHYRRAASLWGRLDKQLGKAAHSLQRVAILTEQGVVPHFTLDYCLKSQEEIKQLTERIGANEENLGEVLEDPGFRLFLLCMIFDPGVEDAATGLAEKMVFRGGKWENEFAERLLQATSVEDSIKFAAARGLLEKGVYSPDEPIVMVLDGRKKEVFVKQLPVVFEAGPSTREAMQKARQLKEKGSYREAIEVLKDVLLREEFFPPAAMNLSNLLRLEGKLEEAEDYLRQAEVVLPEDPKVLFNLSALMVEQKRLKEAQEYLERIELQDEDEEMMSKKKLLEKELNRAKLSEALLPMFELRRQQEERERRKLEEKPITTDVQLHSCLKKMPAGWLTGLCDSLDLEPARRREQREQQLQEALLQKEKLKILYDEVLEKEDRDLLRYLLEKGGWARLSAVSRKFGCLEGEGFKWRFELPNAPQGALWALGLVAIGKARLKNRREKVVVIPRELRAPLTEILLGS